MLACMHTQAKHELLYAVKYYNCNDIFWMLAGMAGGTERSLAAGRCVRGLHCCCMCCTDAAGQPAALAAETTSISAIVLLSVWIVCR